MKAELHQRGSPVVLGVDPGSRLVGFACVQLGRGVGAKALRVVDAGVLRARLDLSHPERLGWLHEALYDLVDALKPDVCAIEQAFCGINVQSSLRLGEARGALITAVRRSGVVVSELTPARVKKTLTGHGAATKEQVAMALKQIWGFDRGRLPYDTTDAMAIALCHAMSVGSHTLQNAFGLRKAAQTFSERGLSR